VISYLGNTQRDNRLKSGSKYRLLATYPIQIGMADKTVNRDRNNFWLLLSLWLSFGFVIFFEQNVILTIPINDFQGV